MYRCLICHNLVFEQQLMVKKDDVWYISGEHAFHYYDTHGIPPQIFEESVNIFIEKLRATYDFN